MRNLCIIIDIQARSFTQVNSRRLQSQCLAITAFCKAQQKNNYIILSSPKKKKLCQKYFDTALLNDFTKLSQVSLERFAVYTCLKTADRFFLNLTYTLTSKTKLLAYFF